MKRNKHHKCKKEVPESSTSHSREHEEHDLAYYIHDRVELMHQVFSVLKHKELRAMAPACVRNISMDDLQELCTEELLGISSKRLCAILDGADPPSDTESSSQSPTEQLETISLDSISSDDEILSREDNSKKKKHKHRHRDAKCKRKKSEGSDDQEADKSKASRAGLTVLELLELQARARAIRAQLQQEQIIPAPESIAVGTTQSQSSDDDVEIKEEPPEVVEISSEDEKPKIEELQTITSKPPTKSTESKSKTVTKRVNDLIITVPQQKTQKIKLKRAKTTPQTTPNIDTNNSTEKVNEDTTKDTDISKTKDKGTAKDKETGKTESKDTPKKKDKIKDKSKKKKKKRLSNTSDNDEITLQLSDTEKMDLLEDLDRKNYDNVSSDSSLASDSEADLKKVAPKPTDAKKDKAKRKSKDETDIDKETIVETDKIVENTEKIENTEEDNVEIKETHSIETENADSNIEIASGCTSQTDLEIVDELKSETDNNCNETTQSDDVASEKEEPNKEDDETVKKDDDEVSKDMSEGELTDRESSEVEAIDVAPEVVCISDEEAGKTKKKKKKKDKKSKKEKKNKKKDFRESGDENYHEITNNIIRITHSSIQELISSPKEDDSSQSLSVEETTKSIEQEKSPEPVQIDLITPEKSQDSIIIEGKEDNQPEIQQIEIEEETQSEIVEISDVVYELSDDSSNAGDIESSDVLSKEPTTSEIEALSAKIDEIEREVVITDEEIREYESKQAEMEREKQKSWKDRYLESKKVIRVLNTSNIMNAIRKKNIEVKRKLVTSKLEKPQDVEDTQEEAVKEAEAPEGSMEHYNTLESLTKFVDPVKEFVPNDTLKKDAKQLLKMYKKLLKYNDMDKKEDPNKKKKKKKKSKKKDEDKKEDETS